MQTALTTPLAGDRQHVPTDQAAPERVFIVWPSDNGCGLAFTVPSKSGQMRTEYIRADLSAPPAPARERCGSCGAFGRKCYGNGPEGPDCDEWIGETDGRACCYACYGSAPAPAEVEGMVAALIKADRGHDPGTLFTEAATAMTAQQAEIERLRGEVAEESAMLEQSFQASEDLAVMLAKANARAEKAEAERDELIAAIGDWARPTGSNGMTTPSEHHPLIVARAKLKGDV